MIKYAKNNTIIINNDIYLTPTCTLKDIITSLYPWEKWITHSQGETVAYRLILGKAKNQYGRLFLIANFTFTSNENALLSSWHLAPEKLMDGIQNNPQSKTMVSPRNRNEAPDNKSTNAYQCLLRSVELFRIYRLPLSFKLQ